MQIDFVNNCIIIDSLPIGDRNSISLPFYYWAEICKRTGINKDKERIFLDILKYNQIARQDVINNSKQINSNFVNLLVQVFDNELDLIGQSNV